MTLAHTFRVLRTAHIAAALLGVLASPLAARAQGTARAFSGLYLGAEAGRVNVIGGANLVDVDTLVQDTRAALTLLAGARYELPFRLVVGREFGYGFEDGACGWTTRHVRSPSSTTTTGTCASAVSRASRSVRAAGRCSSAT
ncbi:MAG: hypothetical protein R2712_16680 [Vicinamibacterales bacterium]